MGKGGKEDARKVREEREAKGEQEAVEKEEVSKGAVERG